MVNDHTGIGCDCDVGSVLDLESLKMETQQRTVDVDGQKMMVSERGPVDGIPILMVHGFPLDHSMWSNQIDGLDPDGERFRIICPDLFGCGQSDLIEDATVWGRSRINWQ